MNATARVGDRVELTAPMLDDPNPIPVGTQGWVDYVNETADFVQYGVRWDSGSKLMLSCPPDEFKTVLKDASRKDIAQMLPGRTFRLRKVGFSDLARGDAYVITVEDVPQGGMLSQEEYEHFRTDFERIKAVCKTRAYKGKRIVSA